MVVFNLKMSFHIPVFCVGKSPPCCRMCRMYPLAAHTLDGSVSDCFPVLGIFSFSHFPLFASNRWILFWICLPVIFYKHSQNLQCVTGCSLHVVLRTCENSKLGKGFPHRVSKCHFFADISDVSVTFWNSGHIKSTQELNFLENCQQKISTRGNC